MSETTARFPLTADVDPCPECGQPVESVSARADPNEDPFGPPLAWPMHVQPCGHQVWGFTARQVDDGVRIGEWVHPQPPPPPAAPVIHANSFRLVRLDPDGNPIPGSQTAVLYGDVTVEGIEEDDGPLWDPAWFDEDDDWEINYGFRWSPAVVTRSVLDDRFNLIGWVDCLPGGPEMRGHP